MEQPSHVDFYPSVKMKYVSYLYLAAAFLFLSTIDANGEKKYSLHDNGLGPVKIGMTVTQASKALGMERKCHRATS